MLMEWKASGVRRGETGMPAGWMDERDERWVREVAKENLDVSVNI